MLCTLYHWPCNPNGAVALIDKEIVLAYILLAVLIFIRLTTAAGRRHLPTCRRGAEKRAQSIFQSIFLSGWPRLPASNITFP